MNLKTRYVVVNYNPTTKEIQSVYIGQKNDRDMTAEECKESCEALNPTNPNLIRHRVGVLITEEE